MEAQKIATALIEGETSDSLAALLDNSSRGKLISIAYLIKEYCYENWSNEPSAAHLALIALEKLDKNSDEPEIFALCEWIRGIAEITDGKLDSALESLTKACTGFEDLKNPLQAAEVRVAMLIPLGLTGDYDKATEVGAHALKDLEHNGNNIAAGKVEINLSNIAARQGRFDEAKRYGISAVRRFNLETDSKWQILAENDLANTLAELNQFDEADELYQKSLIKARLKKMSLTEAEILASIGNLQTFRGQYGPAIKSLEASRRAFEKLDMPHQSVIAELEIAEIYQILNLTDEALDIYNVIPDQLHKFKLRSEEARARTNLGKLALDISKYEQARIELQSASELYRVENNESGLAKVNLLLGRVFLMEGHYEKSLELIDSAREAINRDQFPRLDLEAALVRGQLLRKLNRFGEARANLEACLETAQKSEQLSVAVSALVGLAKVSIAENRKKEAREYLITAVEVVEHLRDPIPAEEFRMTFLANKLEPYELLSELFLAEGDAAAAFIYTEKARSRTLLESTLADSSHQADDVETSKLKERLNWLYSRMSRDVSIETSFHKEIAELEQKLSGRRLREASFNAGSNSERIFIWENFAADIISSMPKEKCLIEFTRSPDFYSLFIAESAGITHFPNVAPVEEVEELLEDLRFQFESLKYGSGRLNKFAEQLLNRTNQILEQLFDLLFAAIEEHVGNKDLVIVPVGSLFYIPFNALYDGTDYLIENRSVTLAPSAAVWINMRSSESINKEKRVGVFAYASDDIPLVYDEASLVRSEFDSGALFVGGEATLSNYHEISPDCDVLHIACHGEFRPDSPVYSNLRMADGFITVNDILRQKLHASLVTLSACETGLSKIYPGDEILGLTRGFLSAGAANIVMSLWTVNDEATSTLMKCFYSELLAGDDICGALRKAQVLKIREEIHPYYWAAFGMIGK